MQDDFNEILQVIPNDRTLVYKCEEIRDNLQVARRLSN